VEKANFLAMARMTMVSAADVLELKSTYGVKHDVLMAFKQEAELARILDLDASNPRHRCINEILKKCCRMVRAEENGFPGGIDSIEDLVVDTINYSLLYKGLVGEKRDE
jgi:hypothetical protein